MEILIAEDDLVQRRFLQALLTQAGHAVAVATNGDEAWH
jgi:CheY-like chemotaxis protein